MKRKITALLLALTIVGTSASPMFSSVVASAASGDDYAGANEDYDFSVPVNGSNKENQTVTIGGNTENIFWANASYYDYMTDNEVKSGWLQNMTQAGTWHEGAKDDWYPFKKFNKYISSLVTNSWKEPLYFGNFYNGNDGPYADSSHNGGYMNAIEGLNNFVHAPNNSRKGVVGHDSIYHESGATQTGIDEEHQSYQRLVDSNLSGGQLTVAGGTPAPYFTQNDYTKVLKSAFPFREETHEDYTKYIFQSSTGDNNQNAADNVYFNWSGDTPTKVNYSYGEKHAVKDAKRYFMYNESSGYGFYPFNEPGGETNVSTRKYLYASVNNQEVGWTNLMVYFIGADSSWDNKHQMEWVRDEDDGKNKVFRYLIPDNATGFVLTNGSGGNENQTVNGSFDDLKFGAVYVDKNTDGGKRKIGRWQQRPSVAGIIDYSTGTEILDHGFGVHMNVKFRVPKGGVAKDGTVITFDFAGDDDLWMFITDDITKESQLVLDMGGNHKKSTGQVNFKDLNSTVNAYNGSGSTTKFTFDYSHTYTMDVFYMERGMIESNCDMSFTMTPLGNNFIVTEEIDTTKVNKGLKEAVTGLSSFTFTPQGGTYDPDNGLSYNVDGEVHNKSGKSSVDLKDGQTLMIPNLFKINDNINLVQTRGDSVLKYSTKYVYKNNTTGRKLDENSHDATVETVTTEKGYLSNTGTDAGDPYEFAELEANFVNTPVVADVTLDKETVDFLRDSLDSGDKGQSDEFPVTVDINFGGSQTLFDFEYTASDIDGTQTASNGVLNIKDGRTITIPNVPVGSTITVSEALTENFDKKEFTDKDGKALKDDKDQPLETYSFTLGEDGGSAFIRNIRKDPDDAKDKVKLNKTITIGLDNAKVTLDDGYEFQLLYNGEVIDTQTIKSAASSASTAFKELTFTVDKTKDSEDYRKQGVFYVTPENLRNGDTQTFNFTVHENLTDAQKKVISAPEDEKVTFEISYDKEKNILTTDPVMQGTAAPKPKDTAEFVNPYKVADLIISKTVARSDGKDPDEQDLSKEFKTTISFTFNNLTFPKGLPLYYTYSDDVGTPHQLVNNQIVLKHNRKVTFSGLPLGTKVQISEQDDSEYSVKYEPQETDIVGDTTIYMNVTNTRQEPKPTSINVDFSKQLLYGTLAKGQFTFELTAGEGIAAGTSKTNDADGKIDFGKVDIKYVKEKPAQPETGVVYLTDDDFKNGQAQLSYTATEVVGGEADIKYDENAFVTNTYTITKTVKDNVTELTATGPVVTKEKMGSAVSDKSFINSKEGEITITKTVRKIDDTGKEVDIDPQKDTKAANETFMAALKFADPGSEEFKSRSFSYSYKDLDGKEGTVTADPDEEYNLELKHGRVITLKGLPYGTQVEITEAKNSNYTPKYPTKIVTVGSDITALSVTNVLQKPGQKIVTFSKTFSEKAVKAGANKEGSGNVYKFTMTGDAGNAVPALASYSDTVTLDQYEGGVLKASGSFKAIDFPADFTYGADGKVFKFTVREIAVDSNDKNIINDTAVYTVSYKVTQGAEGLDIEGPEITRDPVDKDNPNPTEVKFENKYELGNAQVVKVVKDFDDKTIEEYKDVRFTVDVTFDYPGGTSETKSGEILTVNEPLVYTELPVGTKVSVVEKDAHGMDSTVSEPVFVKADAAGTPVTVTVTNKRVNLTPAEVEIPAYKSIQGADIADYDGKFTFELSSNELPGTLTKTNDAEGKITFDKIFFRLKKSETDVPEANTILIDKTAFKGSEPLTYSFKVKEKEPEPKLEDVTIDANEYTVTVTVSKTEDYSSIALSAAVKQDTVPTFTNTKLGKVSFEKKAIDIDGTSYEPDIDFIFKAEKKVGENRWETLTGGERIVINLAKGVKSYETAYLPVGTVVRFTETDSKNFTTTPEAGYQEITVQKDQTASFTFVNTHPEPEGSYLDVSAKKILEGASLEEGKFSFTLNGKIVVDDKTTLTIDEQTKTNAQDGSIKFDRINFSLEKEVAGALKLTKAMFAGAADKTLPIELTVTENKDDSKKDIRYPEQLSQTIKGTITLIDEGSDAHLVAVLTENTLPTFTNVQLARVGFTKAAKDIDGTSFKPDTNFEFSAWKQNGNEWELLEDKIIINIGDSDTSNDSYVTDYLPINTLVKFQEDDAAGFTSLTPVQTVPVTLEKDGKFSTVEFTNKRPVPGTTSAVLKAVKLLEGAQLKDGDFSFTISGEGADANKEYTNKGGNITFDEITYKYSKDESEVTSGSTVVLHDGDFKNGKAVFEYTITEKNTGRPDVLYAVNGSTVTGKVTITKTETASTITLQASTPEYPGGNTFTNKIRKGSAKIVKTNQADEMVDDVTFKLYKVSGNNLDRNQVLSNNAIDVQTTVDGVAEFKNLDLYVDAYQSISDPTYQWYCIAETDPSKEYNLNSGLTFFQVPSADVYDLTFEYMNGKVISPTSGGTGMRMFTVAGLSLLGFGGLAFAGYMLMMRRSNKKRAHYRADK